MDNEVILIDQLQPEFKKVISPEQFAAGLRIGKKNPTSLFLPNINNI